MGNLITPSELERLLDDPRLRIVDTRFDLADTEAGERAYREGHIPGAVYAHLDRDLSGPLREDGRGGRHPLPEPEVLAARLERMGISNGDRVVVYDETGGMFASRLWWLLRYLGHDGVQVLDGGLAAWRAKGRPLSRENPRPEPGKFSASPRPEMTVDRDYLLGRLADPDLLLIDARAAERYRGDIEPIDSRAGHIPGAVNLPFSGNLGESGFLDREELRKRYIRAEGAAEVVAYCGSGVSAAHDVLAMEEAGLTPARLYPGSWSEWSSFPDAPVAQGEES